MDRGDSSCPVCQCAAQLCVCPFALCKVCCKSSNYIDTKEHSLCALTAMVSPWYPQPSFKPYSHVPDFLRLLQQSTPAIAQMPACCNAGMTMTIPPLLTLPLPQLKRRCCAKLLLTCPPISQALWCIWTPVHKRLTVTFTSGIIISNGWIAMTAFVPNYPPYLCHKNYHSRFTIMGS